MLGPDMAQDTDPREVSPAAGGRAGWVVIGAIGAVLVAVLLLAAFGRDTGGGGAAGSAVASGSTDGTSAAAGATPSFASFSAVSLSALGGGSSTILKVLSDGERGARPRGIIPELPR
jgi:hypothetical protein